MTSHIRIASFLSLIVVILMIFQMTSAKAYNGVRNKCPKNCYPMLMMRVLDGDSVQGYIHTNDKESVIYTTLRLEGIDTPETRRAQCDKEKLRGLEAKLYLKDLLDPFIRRRTANIACACDYRGGKFAKRRIGSLKVKRQDRWRDVSLFLTNRCLAVPYKKESRPNWCQCLNNAICPSQFFKKRCVKLFSKTIK